MSTPEAKKPGSGMSVREAGQKGGETVKKKYGPEFYEMIGRKGGQKVKALIEQGKKAAAEAEAAEAAEKKAS